MMRGAEIPLLFLCSFGTEQAAQKTTDNFVYIELLAVLIYFRKNANIYLNQLVDVSA